MSLRGLPLREAGHSIASLSDAIHEFAHLRLVRVVENRRLSGGEIDFHFVHALD